MGAMEKQLLGFIAGHQGSWGKSALDRLHWQLRRAGHDLTREELEARLEAIRPEFEACNAHLFLCAGKPCQNFSSCPVEETAHRIGDDVGNMPITLTDCQGPCNHGPVATLRVGIRSVCLSGFRRDTDVAAMAAYCSRASKAGTHLIDPANALGLIHQEEDHGFDGGKFAPVAFLLGHHIGTGFCGAEQMRFIKEVRGSWEAGGRFLGLRMSATYGLGEDFKDTHSAYVMVGLNPETGGLESRGYTDGGEEIIYPMMVQPGGIIAFPDRVPHSTGATCAEKRLSPTDGGYREVLELKYPDGRRAVYYEISYTSSLHELVEV